MLSAPIEVLPPLTVVSQVVLVQFGEDLPPTTIKTTGGDPDSTVIEITSMPAGLTVSPQTCDPGGCRVTVIGTPAVPTGTYIATVSAFDSFVIAQPGTFTLHVVETSPVIAKGGGRFAWPTGGSAVFNFNIDNSDLGTLPDGKFNLTLRLGKDSTLALKSTSFTTLISDASQESPRIASFSGEASHVEGRGSVPVDGYTFTVRIEDSRMRRLGDDTFWIEVRDGTGQVVEELTLDDPVSITSGNISVIHLTSTVQGPQ